MRFHPNQLRGAHMTRPKMSRPLVLGLAVTLAGGALPFVCRANTAQPNLVMGDAASKVYVAPGAYDDYYAFLSGGFSGQVTVYGLPSGRLLKTVPVFSQFPENGFGYTEESKPMLETTRGFLPWGDSQHPEISQTDRV